MIKLGSALYAHKEETVEITGSNIGKTGIAGLSVSKHRGGVTTGAPKISCIATLFDLLFKYPGSVAACESTAENAVFCEINGIAAMAYGDKIIYSPDKERLSAKYLLIPDVLFELSSYGKNEELKEIFAKLSDSFISTGMIKEDELMMFCDSYYYGCAKDKGSIEDESTLTDSQITAAARSGAFVPHSFLSSKVKTYLSKSRIEELAVSKSRKKSAEKTDFIQDCKDGKYRVPYSWPEALKRYIINPSFLDTFETTPEFEEIVRKIAFRSRRILERMDMGLTGAEAIGKDYMNIMLLGKPGTGKTTLAYALSAATGMPVCTTVHNKHTDEDEYEGKTKIIDGKPAFVETDSLIFHENGGIDVNEEINLADPSVTMGGLGQKTEYPFIVKRNGYETKVRHPLNVVIATMNVGTNGSNPLNQALANRFKTPYILDDPTRETFINILVKSSKKPREVCEWVYEAYEATTQYLRDPDVNEEEICQNLSIRTCLGAIENMEEGQSPQRALVNSIVGAVAVVDVELARRLQREKIDCLPNPTFVF